MTEIPTFPHKHREPPPLAVVVALSLMGGIVGTLLLFWLFPEFRQAEIPLGTQNVIVERPGKVIVEEGMRASDIRRQVLPMVGAIFNPDDAINIGNKKIYLPNIAKGAAVMLTSSGWFATTDDVGVEVGYILLVGTANYTIEQVIDDPISPYVLGKVSNGRFPSVTFIDKDEINPGMSLVVVEPSGAAIRSSLRSASFPFLYTEPTLYSGDKLTHGFTITAASSLPGDSVFSLSGSLVGLISKDSEGQSIVLPTASLSTLLDQVLQSGKVSRLAVGLSYIYIENRQGNGDVVVMGDNLTPAVIPGSPAAKAGLIQGDVINAFNGKFFESPASFFEMIQSAPPASKIVLDVNRDGKKMEVILQSLVLSPEI